MTFTVNYLANFLLILNLLESLDKERGRIVFVSSWCHNPLDPRTFGRAGKEKYLFNDTESLVYPKTKPSEGTVRYGASKLFLLMMMYVHPRPFPHHHPVPPLFWTKMNHTLTFEKQIM
jgi:NAD(P)-dependent dehydrogenase (short-subunit alcohol dehydrogenase family)